MKKILSLIIATILLLNLPLEVVYADELTVNDNIISETQEDNIKTEELQNEGADIGVTGNTTVDGEQNEQDSNQSQLENAPNTSNARNLNYLVINKPIIKKGDIQNVLVSVGY